MTLHLVQQVEMVDSGVVSAKDASVVGSLGNSEGFYKGCQIPSAMLIGRKLLG